MTEDRVYRQTELTGTSTTTIEDALQGAIKRVDRTVRKMSWFQLVETRGRIGRGGIRHWEVGIKVGFALED